MKLPMPELNIFNNEEKRDNSIITSHNSYSFKPLKKHTYKHTQFLFY